MERITTKQYKQLTRPRRHEEFDAQVAIFRVLRDPRNVALCRDLKFAFATHDGVYKGKAQAGKAKAAGGNRGVPDMAIPTKRNDCNGLWIELKSEDGRASDEQLEFMHYLGTQGYRTAICFSADEALTLIERYLEIKLDRTGLYI